MNDFAELLNHMVVLQEGVNMITEAKRKKIDPAAQPEEDTPAPAGAALSLPEMIKMLRKMAIKVKEQADIMDQQMDKMLADLGVSVEDVETQFAGLRHLSNEQQQHIATITEKANTRLKKLKKDLEPLAKLKDKGSVADLVAKVQELEGSLEKKQAEMDTQKQEYEDLLDYYEDIMIDMKHAEMEAKRQLQNAQAAMTGAWEHALKDLEPEVKPLNESVKPKKKKKKRPADYKHYGSFNLAEHLEKARQANPKARGDW